VVQHHYKVRLGLKQATAEPGAVTRKATGDMNDSLVRKRERKKMPKDLKVKAAFSIKEKSFKKIHTFQSGIQN